MNLSALHEFIKTKDEAQETIVLFEKMSDEIFKSNFELKQYLLDNTSNSFLDATLGAITDNNVKIEDKAALQKFLKNAAIEIENLPTAHIILAFPPKKILVTKIQQWFFDNIKSLVVIDISIDPDIIGASIVSFNGRANDYSLKNKIEQMG